MFEGSTVALITPFKDGGVDLDGLGSNINFLIENGTSGILVCGTTGETPTMTEYEIDSVIETAVRIANRRVFVIAGTGTNSTEKSIRATERAKSRGVDGVLLVSPYYNKPTQEGLYRHFREIADRVDIPILLYNIPGRTNVNITPETVERLASDCVNIVAVKEASGNIDQASEIVERCGDRITVLSGDDSLTLPIMSVGGKGVISVVANIVPQDTVQLVRSHREGDIETAQKIHQRLFPLIKALFIETNPIPVKTAMNLLGMPSGELRLPLCPPSPANEERIRKALKDYGLLS